MNKKKACTQGNNQEYPKEQIKAPEFIVTKIPTIAVLSGTTIIMCGIAISGLSIWPEFRQDYSRVLFIIYLCMYLSIWLVYFLSKDGPTPFKVGTLRRLLLVRSNHWPDENADQMLKKEELSKDKARTSITAIAMLISVSFLQMVQAKSFYSDLIKAENSYEPKAWYLTILGFAILSSVIAFISFIISADALDCIFNDFTNTEKKLNKDVEAELGNRLHRYFYRSSINPRYFGVVFLMSSIIFLLAYINPILGCIVIGLILTIGYRHWFPPSNLLKEDWVDTNINSGFWLRLFIFMMPPILLTLYIHLKPF